MAKKNSIFLRLQLRHVMIEIKDFYFEYIHSKYFVELLTELIVDSKFVELFEKIGNCTTRSYISSKT